MHKYEIIIYWSEEDQVFVADVPELPGCMAHGKTQDEALAEAQARLDEAQAAVREIAEMKGERRLARFIQERVTNREYEKHLGIVSTVHNDFKSLSEMLGKGDDPTLPRIDRIILYIDDLDRCPEQKVVDVLQALHLLLAFPLFIVVVGVDSRWLLRSLEQTYPALQKVQVDRTELSEQEMWAWETTPQDYLEKIFQIPFHLHPMDQEGVGNLVRTLLPGRVASSGSASGPAPGQGAWPEEGRSARTDTLLTLRQDDQLDQGAGPQMPPITPEEKGGTLPPQPLPAAVSPLPDVDLAPPALEIKSWERGFVPNLFAMLPTPRDVKRFANIYRLIRAQIEQKDLDSFVGSETAPGEYQVVMILMAIQTGFPRQACQVFDKILSMDTGVSWSVLVDALGVETVPETRPQRFSNGMEESLSAAEAEEWSRLHTILCSLQSHFPQFFTVGTFCDWVPRVARFSFRTGKVAEGLSVRVEVDRTKSEQAVARMKSG